jgi:hypothetical protein
LLVGERVHFLAEDDDRANQFVFLEHWNGNYRPGTGELGKLRTGIAGWHIEILRRIQDVSDLNRLF